MKFDYGKMMKQVQQMQHHVARVEEELADERVETSSGGGAVKVAVSGKQELLEITIDPDATGDTEMLQEMVMAAVNEALRQSKELATKKLSEATGGLGLPGM